ncbi:hypothetical protein [Algoriphagus sp. CAU 1675]|uniref:hypothetical protein n=1 Tax=Algoriphagus sp. CAU 1675 TaxID=3032597 RepID=UPI0023DBB80D|nr:hypothetical protein [Algoriphagus sp. CAU 1675]MDF2158872.1 hypothetical protein [Algoriphagus sp. CAU 1675]
MKLTKNFHFKFLLLTGVIVLLVYGLQNLLPQTVHEKIWAILSFLAIMSYGVGFVTLWLYKKSPENFLQVKLLGMIVRILASLAFITVLVLGGMENIILFIADFFIIFLIYMVFDIYSFMSNLRPISK